MSDVDDDLEGDDDAGDEGDEGDEGDDDAGDDDDDELGIELVPPAPFVASNDYEITEAWAVVKRSDGRRFKVDLCEGKPKRDPYDKGAPRIVHGLVLTAEDDGELWPEVIGSVLDANGTTIADLVATYMREHGSSPSALEGDDAGDDAGDAGDDVGDDSDDDLPMAPSD